MSARVEPRSRVISLLAVTLVVGIFAGLGASLIILPPKTVERTETRTEVLTDTLATTLTSILTSPVTIVQTSTETRTKLEMQTLYEVLTTTETIQTAAAEFRLGYQEWGPLKILSTSFWWYTEEVGLVCAELQNIGSQNLESVTVGIILFDDNDRAIYVDSCHSTVNILLPNQRTPVALAVPSFPYRTYHVFIQSWTETSIKPYREFRVENIKTWIDGNGYFHVAGEVVNTGGLTARSTEAVVTLYDGEGRIVSGSGDGLLISPPDLVPGSRGYFDFFVSLGVGEIDHWLIQVQCSE